MTAHRQTHPCITRELADRERDLDAWLDRLATCAPDERLAVEHNARRVARIAAGTRDLACHAAIPDNVA
jgi:hypothetical protein